MAAKDKAPFPHYPSGTAPPHKKHTIPATRLQQQIPPSRPLPASVRALFPSIPRPAESHDHP